MAPFVHFLIVGDVDDTVALCGNDSCCVSFIQFIAQVIGVKRLISQKCAKRQTFNQRRHTNDLTVLAGQQRKPHQITQRIGQRQDLRAQAAFRTADGLILSPPFAPLALGCVLIIVPSIMAYSKSGSPDTSSKIRSKTPVCA